MAWTVDYSGAPAATIRMPSSMTMAIAAIAAAARRHLKSAVGHAMNATRQLDVAGPAAIAVTSVVVTVGFEKGQVP